MINLKDFIYKAGITVFFFIVAIIILYKAESMDKLVEDIKLQPTMSFKHLEYGQVNNSNISDLNKIIIRSEQSNLNYESRKTSNNEKNPFENELVNTNNNILRSTVLFGKMALSGLRQWFVDNNNCKVL